MANEPPIKEQSRIVVRKHSELTRLASHIGTGKIVTSMAVVLNGIDPAEAARTADTIDSLLSSKARVEFLMLDDQSHPSRRGVINAMRERGHANSLRFAPMRSGGRLDELDSASGVSNGEFLVIPTGGEEPFHLLEAVLGYMWVDGADAAVVGGDESSLSGPPDRDDEPDPPERLARALGVGNPRSSGRIVVIRRWVARWMLNEMDRALDPADEFMDRGRLLGLGVIEVLDL